LSVERDRGLNQAIEAVGGVSELAHKLGLSKSSISNWTRVPAERVIAVEAMSGISRAVLRPDLYAREASAGAGMTSIIGLAGWSGSGKTTLVTKAIPRLIARGLRVSTIKHAHHGFDLDQPGKDSFMHRAAGATEVIVSSARRWAVLHELREEPEWDLPDLLGKLSAVDLILVEGFKRDQQVPKLEIHRVANGKPLIYPEDPSVAAVACDSPLPDTPLPIVDLNDIEAVVDVLLKYAAPLTSVPRGRT
jgi:molybdopterin-guanine dinucleotide biosynthesis protein B